MKKRILILLSLITISLQSAISQPNTENKLRTSFSSGKIDSSKVSLKRWKLSEDLISKKHSNVDTAYDMAHIYVPFFQTSISNAYLGNYGQAGRSNIFVEQHRPDICLFSRYYTPYMITASDINFYNTNKPYANITFNTSSTQTDQQMIDVLYTQNISPNWNAGFQVKGYASKGQFARQQTNGTDIAIFTSYEGKYYSAYAAFSNNKNRALLNGGVAYNQQESNLNLLPILLANASVRLQKRTALFVQTLSLGQTKKNKISDTVTRTAYFKPWVQITHELQFDRDSYAFQDDDVTKVIIDSAYYIASGGNIRTTGTTATKTLFDSVYYRRIENKLQIRFNEDWNQYFKIGLRGGIFHERYDTYNFRFKYTSTNNTDQFSTAGVYAGLFNHKGQRWDWEATTKYMMTGYYKNNFETKADLYKVFRFKRDSIIFNAEFTSIKKKPDFFEQTFYSDSSKLSWSNQFQDKIETYLKAEISNPKHLFSAGINYAQLKNYVYMDSTGKPNQYTPNFSVLTAYLNKTFRIWHFRVAGRVAYQISSSNIPISLPKIAAFGALYYEDCLFKVLFFQLGADAYYHSSFYQAGFTPLTGQFYQQRMIKSKEEPMYDFFLNFRIKRAVVYVKLENATPDFSSSAYFPLEQYPVKSLLFKYGVIWKFHN